MKTKAVKTLYKGMAGVPDKIVKEAIVMGEPFGIWHDGDYMELAPSELTTKRVSVGEHLFKDKFGGDDYYLWHYPWKPTAVQYKMFNGGLKC